MLLKRKLISRYVTLSAISFLSFIIFAGAYSLISFRTEKSALTTSVNLVKDILNQQGLWDSIINNISGMYTIFLLQLAILIIAVTTLLLSLLYLTRLFLIEKKNSHIDPLTELYNRRAIFFGLEKEIQRAIGRKHFVSIAVLDIDFFKKYNDVLGHVAGDRLLKKFSQILKTSVREYDLVGRIGGEEFLIIFPETNLKDAEVICERIRKTVEKTKFYGEPKLPHKNVTVSIGIATFRGPKKIKKETFVNNADVLLYKAKEAGRNIVMVADKNRF